MSEMYLLLLGGLLLSVCGIYQFFATKHYFRGWQKDAATSTSHFVGLSMWSSLVVSIIFTTGGILFLIRGLEMLFIK